MDTLTLARIQFGATIIYHFFFVPLTLGLILIIAIMESFYVATGKEMYKRMAKFWGSLFLINFGMGVVTGIVQEFQFGMNWSAYSRFVGDVFGAPLAIEALAAFFLESTFLGIWIFGWDVLPKKVHLAVVWLIAIASHLSALWILIANSFMQQPLGYTLNNGRAEMSDFFALITNPHVFMQFPHVVSAAMGTGAFFVIGVSAYRILRKQGDLEPFYSSMRIGLTMAIIGTTLALFTGDQQMKHVFKVQPMKGAAAEALWNTEDPAGLSLFTIGNEQTRSDVFTFQIPDLLSFLVHERPTGEVLGINQLQAQYEQQYGPGNYVPSVVTTYWGFRIMVGCGMLMLAVAVLTLYFTWRKQLDKYRWAVWLLIPMISIPFLGNTAGWVLAEMGRQPWLVQGLLRTADGVSPNVGAVELTISLVSFVILYGVLAGVQIMIMSKYAKKDLDVATVPEKETVAVGTY